MPELKVIYVPITELKPAAYNPRKWNEEQIAALKESVKRFGASWTRSSATVLPSA